ncbi:MAG: chaperonin GroEL, partial [Caldilineaceae bacterium]|nr:chaperonin GroEL [Caldilineaceae bacterium]
ILRCGVEVVRRALTAPARQICDNAHVPSSSVIIERIKNFGPTATYDVLSDSVVDAFEAGVLDVTGVLKVVLQTAASTATMALSTDTIVYHKNQNSR